MSLEDGKLLGERKSAAWLAKTALKYVDGHTFTPNQWDVLYEGIDRIEHPERCINDTDRSVSMAHDQQPDINPSDTDTSQGELYQSIFVQGKVEFDECGNPTITCERVPSATIVYTKDIGFGEFETEIIRSPEQ